MRRSLLTLAVCGVLLTGSRAAAQTPTVMPDTTLSRPLVQYVFEMLAPYISRAASDTLVRPWRIELPSSEDPWPSVEQHLMVTLRARPVTEADSQYHHLSFGPLRMSGDTARIRIMTGLTRICPDAPRPGGYTDVDEVYWSRFKAGPFYLWGAVRSDGVRHNEMAINCKLLWQ